MEFGGKGEEGGRRTGENNENSAWRAGRWGHS